MDLGWERELGKIINLGGETEGGEGRDQFGERKFQARSNLYQTRTSEYAKVGVVVITTQYGRTTFNCLLQWEVFKVSLHKEREKN